ncbi:MAG: DUF5666 domain-containing protein [Nitrospirota bacterium]|jgi:hypothetical protein
MKKAVAILVATVLVFSVAGVALAVAEQITGEITAIDESNSTMTLKMADKEKTISYSDDTTVMEGESEMSLSDLRVGDKVTVTCSEKDGERMAEKIMIEKGAE